MRGMRMLIAASSLLVALAACKSEPTGLELAKKQYAEDFEAFRKHVDKTYPFFDLKKIRKEWKTAKKAFKKRAAKCKSDSDFVLLVWDAIGVLRDAQWRRPRSPQRFRRPALPA